MFILALIAAVVLIAALVLTVLIVRDIRDGKAQAGFMAQAAREDAIRDRHAAMGIPARR
jgi:uncharacterized membrane protein